MPSDASASSDAHPAAASPPDAPEGGRPVCVYCSSSDRIDDAFRPVAEALGAGLAARGHTLVYGGGDVGLMGVLARAVHDGGGRVVGVIPERLKVVEGVAYHLADELIVTDTMSARKQIMMRRAEAFVVLPGGFGTLEELMEVMTLRFLGYHARPIVLVNTDGFYDDLLAFFDRLHEAHFARTRATGLLHVAPTPADALAHLDTTFTPEDDTAVPGR
jgi:hypothetical protein